MNGFRPTGKESNIHIVVLKGGIYQNRETGSWGHIVVLQDRVNRNKKVLMV